MKRKQRKDAQETRQRLLAAAAEVFAQKGFWETTHAEICEKAKANTAAVNYHFGSKENLYVEAWKYAFEKSVEAHPPEGGVAPDAPVQERLHGRVLAFMQPHRGPEQPRDRDHAQGNGEPDRASRGDPAARPLSRCGKGFDRLSRSCWGTEPASSR